MPARDPVAERHLGGDRVRVDRQDVDPCLWGVRRAVYPVDAEAGHRAGLPGRGEAVLIGEGEWKIGRGRCQRQIAALGGQGQGPVGRDITAGRDVEQGAGAGGHHAAADVDGAGRALARRRLRHGGDIALAGVAGEAEEILARRGRQPDRAAVDIGRAQCAGRTGAAVVDPQAGGGELAVDPDVEAAGDRRGRGEDRALIRLDRRQVDQAGGRGDAPVEGDGAAGDGGEGSPGSKLQVGVGRHGQGAGGRERQLAQSPRGQGVGREDQLAARRRRDGRLGRPHGGDEVSVGVDRCGLAEGQVVGEVLDRAADDGDVAAGKQWRGRIVGLLEQQHPVDRHLRADGLDPSLVAIDGRFAGAELTGLDLGRPRKGVRADRTLQQRLRGADGQRSRVAALAVGVLVVSAGQQGVGVGAGDAEALLYGGEAVVDPDIDVVRIGVADVDDPPGGVEQLGGLDPAAGEVQPSARDVDDRAALDDDVGGRARCIGTAGRAQHDIAALGHQLRGCDPGLLGVGAGGDQRRADPRHAVRAHARQPRVDGHRRVVEHVAAGRRVGGVVGGHRADGDLPGRAGGGDIF